MLFRSEALVAQRKYADALDALSGARALDTGNARVPLAIAEVRLAMGQPYEALAAFQEARALQPNLIAAQLGAADVLARIERYDDAIAGYRAVLAIDPAAVPARLGLAGALMLQGDALGAEIEYRGIADANPNQPVALNNLAWFLAQRKRGLDQALVWAKRAVELAPEEPAFRTTLGWVHRQRGELPQAAAELERAVGKQPTAERLYYLGQIQADQGRKDQRSEEHTSELQSH